MEQENISDNYTSYSYLSEGTGSGFCETSTSDFQKLTVKEQQLDALTVDVKCQNGHLSQVTISKDDLKWDLVEADEREMGTESHYEAVVCYSCDECGVNVILYLHLWEYPDGVYNDSEIEVENGKIIGGVNHDTIQKLFYQLHNTSDYYGEE